MPWVSSVNVLFCPQPSSMALNVICNIKSKRLYGLFHTTFLNECVFNQIIMRLGGSDNICKFKSNSECSMIHFNDIFCYITAFTLVV